MTMKSTCHLSLVTTGNLNLTAQIHLQANSLEIQEYVKKTPGVKKGRKKHVMIKEDKAKLHVDSFFVFFDKKSELRRNCWCCKYNV